MISTKFHPSPILRFVFLAHLACSSPPRRIAPQSFWCSRALPHMFVGMKASCTSQQPSVLSRPEKAKKEQQPQTPPALPPTPLEPLLLLLLLLSLCLYMSVSVSGLQTAGEFQIWKKPSAGSCCCCVIYISGMMLMISSSSSFSSSSLLQVHQVS